MVTYELYHTLVPFAVCAGSSSSVSESFLASSSYATGLPIDMPILLAWRRSDLKTEPTGLEGPEGGASNPDPFDCCLRCRVTAGCRKCSPMVYGDPP